jgi:hypothetical protein
MANLSIQVKGALALFLVLAALIATYYDSQQVCFVVTVVFSSASCLATATVLFLTLPVYPVKFIIMRRV